MVRIKLKFLVEDVDRHGNVRRYVRRPGQSKIRLRAAPGSQQFLDEYQAALAVNNQPPKKAGQAPPGSFRRLCIDYYGSVAFKSLDPSTQSWRRQHLDRIAMNHGGKPVGMLQAKHVRLLRDELKDTPVVANIRLKALRALFSWAIEDDLAPHDPTIGVKAIKHVTKGFHSWEVSEIEAYEEKHPLGTMAHLAMALLLFTACRREDVVRLGPQHIRTGRIRYRQAKNEHRNPVDMDIPIHPNLQIAIDATPSGQLTFLTTKYRRAYTAAGFGNKFREWCNEAGLSHCSAHGLRKAAATRLAELGATAHEIMAITGHRSLEEVERYTCAARRKNLADAAMGKFK